MLQKFLAVRMLENLSGQLLTLKVIRKSFFEFGFGHKSKMYGDGLDLDTFRQFRHFKRFSQSFPYLSAPGLHSN